MGNLVLSTQVLQEFFAVVTRKLKTSLSLADAREAVEGFAAYPLVQVDLELIRRTIGRLAEEQISLWDALIIEAALEANCAILLTEDLQHGRRLQGLTIHNPFQT